MLVHDSPQRYGVNLFLIQQNACNSIRDMEASLGKMKFHAGVKGASEDYA